MSFVKNSEDTYIIRLFAITSMAQHSKIVLIANLFISKSSTAISSCQNHYANLARHR